MKLVILGPPGAGKGTQANIIATNHNIAHISTGDILREAVAEGSMLGDAAQNYIYAGELVPDEIVIELTLRRLKQKDCEPGYILDGFPRTLEQAKQLHKHQSIDMVLNINISDSVLIKRITGRRSCAVCGAVYHIETNPPAVENVCDICSHELVHRPDDKEDVLLNRIEVYHEQTEPLINFYSTYNLLVDVDGSLEIEEIQKDIEIKINEHFKPNA